MKRTVYAFFFSFFLLSFFKIGVMSDLTPELVQTPGGELATTVSATGTLLDLSPELVQTPGGELATVTDAGPLLGKDSSHTTTHLPLLLYHYYHLLLLLLLLLLLQQLLLS
jgi:hypothetical protein